MILHYHYLYIDEVLKEAIGGIPKCECTNIMEYDQGQGAVVDFDSKTKVAAKIKEAASSGKCIIYTANRQTDKEIACKFIYV